MKQITISDMTPRQAEAGSLSFKNRLELVRELDRAGVDYIEMAPISDPKADSLLIRTAADMITTAGLACPVGLTLEGVETAWQAVSQSANPRLLVLVPVSAVQMEYVCSRKAPKVLELIQELVQAAAGLCQNVEFCAQDAPRAEADFLRSAIRTAIAAGATGVTVCDSAGTMLPDEYRAFLQGLQQDIPELAAVSLGVECSNELGMAAACAIEAVASGAQVIKTSSVGSYPTLSALGQILRIRGDSLGIKCAVDMTGLNRSTERIAEYLTARKESTPYDTIHAEAQAEISLDQDSDITAVGTAARQLGYDLSSGDLSSVYAAFRRIAGYKTVSARDLDTIIASTAYQVPATYKLESYVVNTGNLIHATATVCLNKDGKTLIGLATGDGPVDASFLAIEQILGHHYELDDFQIQAVTEGREAMGSALIRLRDRGRLFSGQGVSTDVIGATIHAYLDALNKIVYEGAW